MNFEKFLESLTITEFYELDCAVRLHRRRAAIQAIKGLELTPEEIKTYETNGYVKCISMVRNRLQHLGLFEVKTLVDLKLNRG